MYFLYYTNVSERLDESGGKQTDNGDTQRGRHDGCFGTGIMAAREAPTALDPSHEITHDNACKHAHDDATEDVARIMHSQIDTTVALQGSPGKQ